VAFLRSIRYGHGEIMGNSKDRKIRHSINNICDVLTKDVLEQSYAELKSIQAVGRKFGVSGTCIKRYMNKFDIKYKTRIKYICDDKFFSYDNENSFYWAGFFAADGNVSRKNDIVLGLSSKDVQHVEKFKSLVKTDAPIYTRMYTCQIDDGRVKKEKTVTTGSVLRFRSRQMAIDLARFNIIPIKLKLMIFQIG
jgi:hypothetical protein